MPQDHPTDNPILNAARRELAERAKATAPLCTANDAYNGPARIVSINTSAQGHAQVARRRRARHRYRAIWPRLRRTRRALAPPGLFFSRGVHPDGGGTRARCARGRLWRELHNPGPQPALAPPGNAAQAWKRRIVEISQIGKVCHTRCAIYYLAGDCIFPHEGIFGVVLKGGEVYAGDDIQVIKLGDGTCSFTPAEAIEEIEQARQKGTL